MREKFEILAKISGWNGSLSQKNSTEFSADPGSLSKLIEHVVAVLERREITCIELNRSLERQQLELEASREQVNLASIRLKEMRDRLTGSESQIIELSSKNSTLTAQILIFEQNLKREKSQASWSSQELENTLEAFSAFRKEQSVLMAEIRLQSELANSQAQETQQRFQRTVQSLKEREKQVSDFQEQVAHLKSQLTTNEVNFTREMNSNTRMIDLYKNASEEAVERISLLQQEIEELRVMLSSAEAQDSGHSADLEAELEDRENLIKSKEEQMEKMRIALDGLLKVAKATAESGSEPLSLTADILNEFATNSSNGSDAASKVSVKQIYAEYAVCRGKLVKAEEESSQMRITMQEMINEINSRAPLFESLQLDNSRLQGDVSILTEQLISAASSRDAAIGYRSELERNLAALQVEKEEIQQECNDLSQQVQRLLLEIESYAYASNNTDTQANKRQRSSGNESVLRATEIITENLVDLTSVAQLQQRNQELLRSLRSITAKYEALEKEKESPQLKAQLDAVLRELDEMHEARTRQAQMVETIFKTKPSTGISENSSKSSVISETLTNELEQLQKQLASKQESLKKALLELEIAKRELTDEKVLNARLSAQFELNEERLKMLTETLKQERLDSIAVRERISSQMDSFSQAQTSSYKLMADLSSAQERESRLHAQIEKLQNELNSLAIETSRLQQEVSSSSGERDRLTGILSSMQGVLNEHEASESTLKRHFTAQVEFMERELEASRARISEITTSHSSALSTLERDRSELFKRLESLSEELAHKKEINLRLESSLIQSQEKVSDLERVLQHAATESVHEESNVKAFELRIRALSIDLKNQQSALQQSNSRVSELEGQLQEMEDLKTQLTTEKENSIVKEASLQEYFAEIEHLKGDKERLEEELNNLKEKIIANQEKETSLTEEIRILREEIKTKSSIINSIEEEKVQISIQLNEAKSSQVILETKLSTGEIEQKYLKTRIENLEETVNSLKKQNETLLDDAQKMVLSSSSEELEGENSFGVIKFLRDEKDKLQVEREKLLFEIRQYQIQIDEVQRTLNSERLEVSVQSADYARLLSEIERLNSLREGGALKQHEFTQMKMKISILESQLKEKNSSLSPLKESLETAQGEIDQLKESLGMIQIDRDSWKLRFETAISTASDSNSPLETELKQVKMQSEMFRQRAIALTKNLSETRSAAQKEIEELQKEVSNLSSKLEIANNTISHDVEMSHDEVTNVGSIQIEEAVQESSEAECEEEEEDEEENSNERDDSIYEDPSESVNESISVSETVSVAEPTVNAPQTVIETISAPELVVVELAPPPLVPALVTEPITVPPLVAAPTLTSFNTTATENPRKKIVSLAGIVGSSSVSAPVMITTASGKKFVPVTFPDPPSVSSLHSTLGNSATSSPSNPPGSPTTDKTKKIKKGLGKKKNKIAKKLE